MPSRRHVLALLAATPFAGCAAQPQTEAIASWRDPGAGEADPRRFALAHAILAPNPHNTQPWQVELPGEDEMVLYCDLARTLPFTDPPNRQITLGCGAFLALYAMKAGQCEIDYFPEGEPDGLLDQRPLARVHNQPRLDPPDPLAAHITARRTNRNVYDARVPDEATLAAVIAAAGIEGAPLSFGFTNDPARVATLRDLTWRGFEREMRTRGAQEETYRWLRFGREEQARYRDGLFIDIPAPGLLRALGLLDEADIINPDSGANKQAARDWRAKAESAQAYIWITTPDDRPSTRLAAGTAYARLNLAATAAGLAIHPWSQALQEYEEMADLYSEARAHFGVDGAAKLQMLVRVGRAEPSEPAARRSVSDLMRT